MRLPAALAAASVLAGAACGASGEYAGLTGDEARERVAAALRAAEARGAVAEQVGEAMAGSPQEAMGRTGAASLGSGGPQVLRKPVKVVHGKTPAAGRAAWVGAYALTGIGSALSLCVYVWDGGSAVDARARC